MIDSVTNLACSLCSQRKRTGKKETAINGSPKVNVPEDKLSFKHDPGKKKKGETKDREVRHPRDTHQAIRMIQSELPATRLVSSSNKESGTKRRHVSACILPNASTTEKAVVTTAKRVCSFIPRRKIKATTERQREINFYRQCSSQCGRRLHGKSEKNSRWHYYLISSFLFFH